MLLLPYILQIRVLVGDHHRKLPDSLSVFFLSHLCFLGLSLNLLQGKIVGKRENRKTTLSVGTILFFCWGDYSSENLKIILKNLLQSFFHKLAVSTICIFSSYQEISLRWCGRRCWALGCFGFITVSGDSQGGNTSWSDIHRSG